VREGEVDVIAAEQEVVADCQALDARRRRAGPGRDSKRLKSVVPPPMSMTQEMPRPIQLPGATPSGRSGRSKNHPARHALRANGRTPRLGLFDEPDIFREAGLPCGIEGEPLRAASQEAGR